jgi:hypothetical protein
MLQTQAHLRNSCRSVGGYISEAVLPPRRSQSSGSDRRTGSGLRWFQQHQSSQTERAIRYQDPGWKDCAARYIHTELSAATMKIFRPEDAPVLEYREDDGQDRTHILCSHHSDGPRQFVHPLHLQASVRASRRSIL